MKKTPAYIMVVAWLCLMASAIAAAPRIWTSKDGAATITATFHKTDGEKVTLILPNGRSQIVEKKFLSDADLQWIGENTGGAAVEPAEASASAAAKIPTALAGKLIDDRGKPYELASGAASPKYYLFYYSASWCGPCHVFTPKLVQFYRKMKGRKASLEVILSPSDRTLEDEIAYMKETRMPWPGLALDQKGGKDIPQSTYGYIPAMVLVDADGNRLLQVSKELSRDEFLEQAEDILKNGASSTTAQN